MGTEQIRICEKALLNVNEIMLYTGWGENNVRNKLNHPKLYSLIIFIFSLNYSFIVSSLIQGL